MNLIKPSRNFTQWFDRCLGSWVSHRRYLYFSGSVREPMNQGIRTEFVTGKRAESDYFVSWESMHDDGTPSSSGTMNFIIEGNRFTGHRIVRDRAYFSDTTTVTRLEFIDKDTLAFFSAYGGNHYREEIRFLSGDDIRLRQTIGFSDRDMKHRICGQYMELRQ